MLKPVRSCPGGCAADVPILMAYFHYPEKIIGFGETLFHPGDDAAADMARVREWYRPWQGRNRDSG